MSTLKRRSHNNRTYHNGDDNVITFSNGSVIPIYAITKISAYDDEQETPGVTWSHRLHLNNGDVSLITQGGYEEIVKKIKKIKLT